MEERINSLSFYAPIGSWELHGMTLTVRPMSVAIALLAAMMILAWGLPPVAAQATQPPPPELKLTLFATTIGSNPRFELPGGGTEILVGQVPTLLNITIINKDSTPQQHTFSINSAQAPTGPPIINAYMNTTGVVGHVTFQLNATNKVRIGNATPVNAQADSSGLGIRFYCIPHQAAGMVGVIRVASNTTPGPTGYQGFQLWAFWIGSIAMVATIGFMGVTYFIIKASSRHNTDEREHIRRGLP